MQEELQESEERFRRFLNNLPSGWRCWTVIIVLQSQSQVGEMVGYGETKLTRLTLHGYHPPGRF